MTTHSFQAESIAGPGKLDGENALTSTPAKLVHGRQLRQALCRAFGLDHPDQGPPDRVAPHHTAWPYVDLRRMSRRAFEPYARAVLLS